MEKFKTVGVGGTFDELHKGHRALLVTAFEVGSHVVVGLSSDEFAGKMGKPHVTASYDERLKELKRFLGSNGFLQKAEIICLNDPYGGVLQPNSPIEALVVSKETEPVARNINEKRKASGLPPLKIIVIKMIHSENHGLISTTRIRRGEIDREGRLLKT